LQGHNEESHLNIQLQSNSLSEKKLIKITIHAYFSTASLLFKTCFIF